MNSFFGKCRVTKPHYISSDAIRERLPLFTTAKKSFFHMLLRNGYLEINSYPEMSDFHCFVVLHLFACKDRPAQNREAGAAFSWRVEDWYFPSRTCFSSPGIKIALLALAATTCSSYSVLQWNWLPLEQISALVFEIQLKSSREVNMLK